MSSPISLAHTSMLILLLSLLATNQDALAEPVILSADQNFEAAAEFYRDSRYKDAYIRFLPLAEAGDPRAQTVIALMHKYGESVPLDLDQAYQWYLKAANAGYPPAQYTVATMLREGSGVPQDTEGAKYWFRLAAAGGYERADHELATLAYEDEFNPASKTPSTWSQPWNLRLPNDFRLDLPPDASLMPSYRVQLGAMGSEMAARRLWNIVTDPNRDLFQDLELTIHQHRESDQIIYRVQTGPFATLEGAMGFCAKLKDRVDTGCLPLSIP